MARSAYASCWIRRVRRVADSQDEAPSSLRGTTLPVQERSPCKESARVADPRAVLSLSLRKSKDATNRYDAAVGTRITQCVCVVTRLPGFWTVLSDRGVMHMVPRWMHGCKAQHSRWPPPARRHLTFQSTLIMCAQAKCTDDNRQREQGLSTAASVSPLVGLVCTV
jgi:hypothetical protein